LPRRSRNTPAASGDSAPGPAEASLSDFQPARQAPASVKWGDLRTRALSAAILAPIAIICLWAGGWPWIAMVAVLTVALAAEWFTLTRGRASPALIGAGVPYIALATIALLWLRADPDFGRVNVLFVVLIVWTSDIGAYVTGRLLGGPRLAPAISPGKTWSGAIGALAAAAIAGLCIAAGTGAMARGAFLTAPLVAAGLSVVAQAGDLLESALKRQLGVKDSGRTIPGHGGLFDRLDGMLTAAPAAALLAVFLGRGVELWG
jgi:phosphatidate cytidylyltransferase